MIMKMLKGLMDLCLLRGSPAFLPNSYIVLTILVLIVISFDVISYTQIPNVSLLESFASTLLSRAVMLGLIYALLAQKKSQGRFIKVIIAFLGTMLLLGVLSELISTLISQEERGVIAVVFSIWIMLAGGYVLKLALDTKMTIGLLLTLGLHVAAVMSTYLIIGEQITAQLPVNPG